jgi:LacI family transcriptional regulator
MTSKNDITINDIARAANVSISTVSRVLRGNVPVTESKRLAVLAAVEELDYEPNVFARGLVSGESMVIGVLTQYFGSPFYDAILQGIVRRLHGTDYFPIFTDGQWDPQIERETILALVRRRIDGLIVVGGSLPVDEICSYATQFPLLVVGRRLPGIEENCLCLDNRKAAYTVTQHLLDLGHRRIAHISGPVNYPDAVDRKQGFFQALEEAGIEPIPELIFEGTFRRQSGVIAVDMLLSNGISFSAIFAANDQMAFGTRLALHRRGIRVPEDLSLVGFDDEPAAAFMIPPLTTVRQPGIELGFEAAKIILARLEGQSVSIPKFEAELIVRESTAIQL